MPLSRGRVRDPLVAWEREQPQRLIQQSFRYAQSEPQLNQAHAAIEERLLADTKPLEYRFDYQRGQPAALDPMQATQVATPFHRPGWVYEEKVDGYRMVAYKVASSVQLLSRQGKEFTQRFLDLAKAVASLGAESAILDTEVAVFDVSGRDDHLESSSLAVPSMALSIAVCSCRSRSCVSR